MISHDDPNIIIGEFVTVVWETPPFVDFFFVFVNYLKGPLVCVVENYDDFIWLYCWWNTMSLHILLNTLFCLQ